MASGWPGCSCSSRASGRAGTTAPATTTSTTAAPTSAGPSWTVYHGNAEGNGVAPTVSSVNLAAPAWTSPVLDGQLYGEPLVSDGRVIVATENDTVYALSSTTGSVEWSTHLGTPVPSGSLPCGDISPTVGITGTPVIDADARRRSSWWPTSSSTGARRTSWSGWTRRPARSELSQDVDPAGATPPTSSNARV